MRVAVFVAVLLVTACQAEEPKPTIGIGPAAGGAIEHENDCAATGGQMVRGGFGQLVCERPTKDAGKACNSSKDCEGHCLADGQVCTSRMPYFGCYETYENGATPTLCVD
jgi:hypothetical protein